MMVVWQLYCENDGRQKRVKCEIKRVSSNKEHKLGKNSSRVEQSISPNEAYASAHNGTSFYKIRVVEVMKIER